MKKVDFVLPVSDEGLYPIRTVSEVSGVNSITLRVWERRYGLFKPKRTPKGHRLYSDKDIQRVHQVLAVLAKGVRIGRVAKALEDKQQEPSYPKLLSIMSDNTEANKLTTTQWKDFQKGLLSRISTYDILQLENFHDDLLSRYAIESVSKNLILPVLVELSKSSQQLPSLSGAYHFYRIFLLQKLGELFQKASINSTGKKILLMGLVSEHCDIELQIMIIPLVLRGHQVVNLGCDMTLDAISMPLSVSKVEGLVLYSDNKISEYVSSKAINRIVSSSNKPIFITGEYSKDQEKELSESGLIVLPSSSEKQSALIDKILNKT